MSEFFRKQKVYKQTMQILSTITVPQFMGKNVSKSQNASASRFSSGDIHTNTHWELFTKWELLDFGNNTKDTTK